MNVVMSDVLKPPLLVLEMVISQAPNAWRMDRETMSA